MSIHTTCPSCQSEFTLDEAMDGKKIRCGKCQEVFKVVAEAEEIEDVVEEVEDVEEEQPKARIKATPPPKLSGGSSSKRRHEDDEEEDDAPPRRRDIVQPQRNNMPWLVGGAVACVALLVGGGITIAMLLRGDKDEKPVVNNPPVVVANNTPTTTTTKPVLTQPPPIIQPILPPSNPPPPPVTETKPPTTTVTNPPRKDPTRPGELTREAMQEVKRATVYLRVTLPDGTVASGTGFFGAPDAPSIVLTNAHVVGMLSSGARRPRKIEVILNSGQSDEKTTTALILGVDRSSDLAVLDVGTSAGMPKPLNVKSGDELHELDKVYIFGFPLGERLGKEITIRPSSVSSLRKTSGVLDKIQVAGGMDPGNSGGPVVDESGQVVGVAVAGIPGMLINFAIPGDRVGSILNGRISELATGQPFKNGERLGVPVAMAMIDPRNKVKEVGVEVWVGNAPDPKASTRPPSMEKTPAPVDGDTARQKFRLEYLGGMGRGEVLLPALPAGKVYWLQPTWTGPSGKQAWAMANVYKPTSMPVERRSAALHARYNETRPRRLDIAMTTRFMMGPDAESEVAQVVHNASFMESGRGSTAATLLRLAYRSIDQHATVNKRKSVNPNLDLFRPNIKKIVGLVELDGGGNLRANTVENGLELASDETGKKLLLMHEPIRLALYPLLLGLPNRPVNALETWKAERQLPVPTIGGLMQGRLELSCTYLGVRSVGGRDEAVINLDGIIRDTRLAGRARGQAILDLSAGMIKKVDMDVDVDMPPLEIELQEGKKEKIRVLSIVSMKLDRSM
jgi:predicted Zn finger-like uncharacterized protein